MKPRIKYVRPHLFGIPFDPCWACSSPESIQYGKTPSEAYQAWLADMPKTVPGCLLRRVLNRAFDAFVG